VLLEPAEDEQASVRRLQISLQSVYGGHPHERVHLTCQRFALAEEGMLPAIIQHLTDNLAAVQPFPLTAGSLVQFESRFWQSRLLRWRIEASADLRRMARGVDDGLVAAGVTLHHPQTSGWVPSLVTALEAIPAVDFDLHRRDIAFPQYLFTGRQVVLSRIAGHREFEILEAIQLAAGRHA
jgi:hypothetical protein